MFLNRTVLLATCAIWFVRLSPAEEPQPLLKELWTFKDEGVSSTSALNTPTSEQKVSPPILLRDRFLGESDNALFFAGNVVGQVYKIDADNGRVIWEKKIDRNVWFSYVNCGYLVIRCSIPRVSSTTKVTPLESLSSEFVIMSASTGEVVSRVLYPSELVLELGRGRAHGMGLLGRLMDGPLELPNETIARRKEYVEHCRKLVEQLEQPDPKTWTAEALDISLRRDVPYKEGPFLRTCFLEQQDANQYKFEHWLLRHSEDGKILWKSLLPFIGCVRAETVTSAFVGWENTILCYSKETGTKLWEYNLKLDGGQSHTDPEVSLFRNFVAIWYQDIYDNPRPSGNNYPLSQYKLVLISQETGKETFSYTFQCMEGRAFCGKDHIYIVDLSGKVVCLGSPPAK
jgi:hypothetical protein